MRYDRLVRAEEAARVFWERGRQSGDAITTSLVAAFAAEFAEAEVRAAVAEFVAKVNARAEADMLAGNPITGAHHRALIVELATVEASGAREGTG